MGRQRTLQDPAEKPVSTILNNEDWAMLERLVANHRGSRSHVLRSALRYYAQSMVKDTVTAL